MVYLSLTRQQLQELRDFSRTAVGRVALRALMVLWRAEDLSTIEIAELLGCDRQSITPWIDRYLALGLAGLYDEPRSGRPRHIDADTIDEMEAALDDPPPDEDGLPVRWTLSRMLARFSGKASHVFGIETLRRTLHNRDSGPWLSISPLLRHKLLQAYCRCGCTKSRNIRWYYVCIKNCFCSSQAGVVMITAPSGRKTCPEV